MSTNVVTPLRMSSAQLRFAPARTKSAFTKRASRGKMTSVSHGCSAMSGPTPRRRLMGMWVWPFTRPGSTTQPVQSSVWAG